MIGILTANNLDDNVLHLCDGDSTILPNSAGLLEYLRILLRFLNTNNLSLQIVSIFISHVYEVQARRDFIKSSTNYDTNINEGDVV